jgi:hypothetical protein
MGDRWHVTIQCVDGHVWQTKRLKVSTEKLPSWEADSPSESREYHLLWDCRFVVAFIVALRTIVILSSHLCLCLPNSLFHIINQFYFHLDIFILNQAKQEECSEKNSRINSSSQWSFNRLMQYSLVEVYYVSERHPASFLRVEKCPKAGDIMFLRIVCSVLPEYIPSYPRRQ